MKFTIATCSWFIPLFVTFVYKNYEALLFRTHTWQVLTPFWAVVLVLKMELSCVRGSCQIFVLLLQITAIKIRPSYRLYEIALCCYISTSLDGTNISNSQFLGGWGGGGWSFLLRILIFVTVCFENVPRYLE